MIKPLHILLIDNYDSYTYNLYQLLIHLPIAVRVTVVKNDDMESVILRGLLSLFDNPVSDPYSICDALLIGPGPGSPDEIEEAQLDTESTDRNTLGMRNLQKLIEVCKRFCIPLLGVCLGHQAIGISFGSKMIRATIPMHGRSSMLEYHDVQKTKYPNLFSEMKSPLTLVIRYHSLLLNPLTLPSCLMVTATTTDGSSRSIMAIQSAQYPIYGVQFHPESVATPNGKDFVFQFVKLAKELLDCNPKTNITINSPLTTITKNHLSNSRSFVPVHLIRRAIKLPKYENSILDTALNILNEFHDDLSLPFFMTKQDTSSIILGKSELGLAYSISSQRVITYAPFSPVCCNDTTSDIFEYFDKELYSSVVTIDCNAGEGFIGGWGGAFGYELHQQTLPQPKQYNMVQHFEYSDFDSCWIWIDKWIEIIDNIAYISMLTIDESVNPQVNWFGKYLMKTLEVGTNKVPNWIVQMEKLINSLGSTYDDEIQLEIEKPLTSSLEKEKVISIIQKCKQKWIEQGDSYELCITWPFNACISPRKTSNPSKALSTIQKRKIEFHMFKQLVKNNFAPYSCYMNWMNWWNCCFCSATPELFLSYNTDSRKAKMKPMKGTMKRDLFDSDRDNELKRLLSESEKDKSENLMIVDLTRNDLGKLSSNVYVTELFSVETFPKVHQMTSTIIAEMFNIESNESVITSLIRATFPPGSMTGAPKTKSVQILRDCIEGPESRRGLYSGIAGWIGLKAMTSNGPRDGDCQLGVVIRTPLIHYDWDSGDHPVWNVCIQSGAAILYQSDAEAEWEEVLLKAHSTWSSVIR